MSFEPLNGQGSQPDQILVKAPLYALCDQCLPHEMLASCKDVFGCASSVASLGLCGTKDDKLWDIACDTGVHLIFTKDLDLGSPNALSRIAIEEWCDEVILQLQDGEFEPDLPMVVHLPQLMKPAAFDKALKGSAHDLFNLHSRFVSPILNLDENGLSSRFEIEDLLVEQHKSVRNERYAYKFLARVLPEEQWKNRKSPRVKRTKDKVTRAVGIASRGRALLLQELGVSPYDSVLRRASCSL